MLQPNTIDIHVHHRERYGRKIFLLHTEGNKVHPSRVAPKLGPIRHEYRASTMVTLRSVQSQVVCPRAGRREEHWRRS